MGGSFDHAVLPGWTATTRVGTQPTRCGSSTPTAGRSPVAGAAAHPLHLRRCPRSPPRATSSPWPVAIFGHGYRGATAWRCSASPTPSPASAWPSVPSTCPATAWSPGLSDDLASWPRTLLAGTRPGALLRAPAPTAGRPRSLTNDGRTWTPGVDFSGPPTCFHTRDMVRQGGGGLVMQFVRALRNCGSNEMGRRHRRGRCPRGVVRLERRWPAGHRRALTRTCSC